MLAHMWMARPMNIKLDIWMEDDDTHQPQVPWPPRSKVTWQVWAILAQCCSCVIRGWQGHTVSAEPGGLWWCRLIEKACQRLAKLESEGRESYDAWNETSVDLVKAAKVWLWWRRFVEELWWNKLLILMCLSDIVRGTCCDIPCRDVVGQLVVCWVVTFLNYG